MAKAAFNNKKTLFTSKLDLKFKEKIRKVLHLEYILYCAETWTFWKCDQKYLESSAMWCRRRMEMINWTDHVRNEEVLQRVKVERKQKKQG